MPRRKNDLTTSKNGIDYGIPEMIVNIRGSKKQTVNEKLAELQKMDNLQFEHYMARLFALKGYEVKYTPVADDCGADLIIARDGEIIAVRCLLGEEILGTAIIDITLDAMLHYAVHKVMIVTNQMFSAEALKYARRKPIILVDKDILIEDYLKMRL